MSSSSSIVVALAQINPVVGDLVGNVRLLADAARTAYGKGAALVVAPELSLTGYPPEDLLFRPAFLDACAVALQGLAASLADCVGLHLIVGHPLRLGDGGSSNSRSQYFAEVYNAASVITEGKVVASYCKRELPNYQVFDERRYFKSGRDSGMGSCVVSIGGFRIGLLICEDAWYEEPGRLAREAGAEILCVLNASPFHIGKQVERELRMSSRASELSIPLLYSHLVGGQDEVVFDGASFAVDKNGNVSARAVSFESECLLISVGKDGSVHGGMAPIPDLETQIWQALVLGVRDYLGKNGFPGAIIGLSGGIDSALVLAIAVDALGPNRVRAVMMPSAYTADISWIDSREMVKRLGVRYDEIPIHSMVNAFEDALAEQFRGLPADATEENIQARVRGTLLMALSNKTGDIVLTTGNKSEMATGYCTLYGDMAGGYAVIKDVAKTLVYQLANWRNKSGAILNSNISSAVIPERIITRPPSAELRPDQTDQDSLPVYEVLDGILGLYMEENQSVEAIISAGYDRADVEKVTRLIKLNEYKRRQSPVGIRITHRAFGRDWRYPITSKFRA